METEKQAVITERIVKEIKEYLGDKLDKIILYGSYARGDYDEDSDIDILILANIEHTATPKYYPKLRDISHDISLENDVILSLLFNSADFFNANAKTHAFCKNVIREGRILYGSDSRFG
ncbi:MAG: nucleotidyltransferase domain-containing protein [Chitinispirillales bacterium]|jgi:predicted nucleotidyltransferase|nr:nucleotidyltransferase domain-containing protein [Chitinispirillales bacterium]